jgi:intracellular protein transport protein USO1
MLKTPPLQTATATIDTLCGRLQSATLLEDRRAAILGLRSFAKQYPASVASGSLRELISTLRRDGLGEKGSKDERNKGAGNEGTGDVDTIRLVLETLLMLFNPDSNSPEAGDEIALFLADEFSMVCQHIGLHMCIYFRRIDRAKLILAPRQHHSTLEPPRSHQSLRRLLLPPV